MLDKIYKFASRVQELDGCFFEKFGSLLGQQGEEGPPTDDHFTPECVDGAEIEIEVAGTTKDELVSNVVGWNVEELYMEMLYEVLHLIGYEFHSDTERETLFVYMREAFKFDEEKHNQLLTAARAKEAPNLVLNVEVVEAKNLNWKDANGLSDPFCTLFLESSPTRRYNTSVKQTTLTPTWEEHFSLPVDNAADEILHLEVWDFDPAETIREKVKKIGDVKGVRGLSKLMKEIAVTASTGKHDNELIGSCQVPLKHIPASGLNAWYKLEKKAKGKKQGDVKMLLTMSSEKNRHVAAQEHRHLLRILLLHELEKNKVEQYKWDGRFSASGDLLVTQHAAQGGLNDLDLALSCWTVYSSIHVDHHLSFQLFQRALDTLTPAIKSKTILEEETRQFWEATKKLMPSCLSFIRKLRKTNLGDRTTMTQLNALLRILSELVQLKPPKGMELFPVNLYGWLSNKTVESNDIFQAVGDAVSQGGSDWFFSVVENINVEDNTQEAKLKHLIKVVQLLRADLQKGMEFHDKMFQVCLQFPYVKTVFQQYDSNLAQLVEPTVSDICRSLRPLKYDDGSDTRPSIELSLNMGTTLFELYLVLQKFSTLGPELCPDNADKLQTVQFHVWFHAGVAQWLDIAQFKALQRISKAVELDPLVPVDSSVKYSSSAVDTLAIFYQIKVFWKQLSWPDVEGSYTFVAKIMDDICRCSIFYAEKMSTKVEELWKSGSQGKFQVTNEWCLAINNIAYVEQSIQPFVTELGFDAILQSLAEYRSPSAAEHCRQTLQLVVDNATENVSNKILELLDTVGERMTPAIQHFLMEGAEVITLNDTPVEMLMQYLDDNLLRLHTQLNAENFERILSIIWDKLSLVMYELVESNLEKRRPPSFFQKLHETLKILIRFFHESDSEKQVPRSETLDKMEHLLELHGMSTQELIHLYYLERLNEQNSFEVTEMGMLTVVAYILKTTLHITILNARNLRPMDSNEHKLRRRTITEDKESSPPYDKVEKGDTPRKSRKSSSKDMERLKPSPPRKSVVSGSEAKKKERKPSISSPDGKKRRASSTEEKQSTFGAGLKKLKTLNEKARAPSKALVRYRPNPLSALQQFLHKIPIPRSCDPYVKAHLVPEDKFPGIVKPKTKVVKKMLFPLFEESFAVPLTQEQLVIPQALIHFVIKDHDLLGMNEFVSEGFLKIASLPHLSDSSSVPSLEQTHLKLTRPSKTDSDPIQALEYRQWDKLARDFVKKEKQKMPLKT